MCRIPHSWFSFILIEFSYDFKTLRFLVPSSSELRQIPALQGISTGVRDYAIFLAASERRGLRIMKKALFYSPRKRKKTYWEGNADFWSENLSWRYSKRSIHITFSSISRYLRSDCGPRHRVDPKAQSGLSLLLIWMISSRVFISFSEISVL